MKRYLTLWLVLTAVLIALVALVNAAVDPYGLVRWIDRPGFNASKPQSGLHGGVVKAYQVLRVAPRTLVLGNSRAEVGFDPASAAWPADSRPVYNAALPGNGPDTSVAYLTHVIAAAAEGRVPLPKTVVWGIDFSDFLNDPNGRPRRGPAPATSARLLSTTVHSGDVRHLLQRVRDDAEATLTLGALIDSLQTLAVQRNPNATTVTPLGFNPLRQYIDATAQEGAGSIFDQKIAADTAAYGRRPHSLFDASGRWSGDLEDLRLMLELCRTHGIALHIVIYPLHAYLMESIRLTGHWDESEQWKRIVVRTVEEDARAAGTRPVPLWDFSGFDDYTTEAVPAVNDRTTKPRWFWEGGHFKSELGTRVLERVLAAPGADPRFGVLLDSGGLEGHIAAMRAKERDYRASHADDVERVRRIAAKLGLRDAVP